MTKENTVAWFQVQSRHLPGGIENCQVISQYSDKDSKRVPL